MIKQYLFIAFLVVFASGCATQNQIYYWGEYEETLYKAYKTPGEMPAERQIEVMEADFEKAKSRNKPLPPGWHAHLGLMYYDLGKFADAQREFRTEKANFPESAALMDFFLKTAKQVKKK